MNPARSIIVFTVASGAGCGVLAVTGACAAIGLLPGGPPVGLRATALALVLIAVGLAAASCHLGRPERMLQTFRQWRSSWLTREAIAALGTVIFAGVSIVVGVLPGDHGSAWAWSCVPAVVLAMATVSCAAMIYASLRAVPQWHNAFVLPCYLLLSLMTGTLLLVLFAQLSAINHAAVDIFAAAVICAALLAKTGYWRHIDHMRPKSDIGTATGLGRFGAVRLLDPPQSEADFAIGELDRRIARGTARRLRLIVLVLLFACPLALTLIPIATSVASLGPAAIAVLSATVGVLLERWLFFAEARQTRMLAYV